MEIDCNVKFHIIPPIHYYIFILIFMSGFIKESLEELDHVVWPTQAESKKYMYYTVGVIVSMAILLAVLGYALQQWLKWARAQFPHNPIVTETTGTGDDLATKADLEKIKESLAKKRAANNSGTTSTGAAKTGTGN